MSLPRSLKITLAGTASLVPLGIAAVYAMVAASLPILDGEIPLAGLQYPVTVERDALGVPTVRGATRAGVARATGFLHAQDRFFQMDLVRRDAAGELAALVGPAAVGRDRERRIHRLRTVAAEALARSTAEQRALLEAYSAGVNRGVQMLGSRPFEYWLLGAKPLPWRPEDTFLVIFSMYFTLTDERAEREERLGVMAETLPPELFAFLNQPGTPWDAPLHGEPYIPDSPPGPQIYDLRDLDTALFAALPPVTDVDEVLEGSNGWAVAGAHTADGGAIVANDMHLDLRVPNTWYRMRVVVDSVDVTLDATGLSLPGTPALVAGSNGSVAWGFTNSYGDWSDRILLEVDAEDAGRYHTPAGLRAFDQHAEIISVNGAPDQSLTVRSTIWGPVLEPDHRGRLRALRWLAHDPEATNIGLVDMEGAQDIHTALLAAQRAGLPPQNIMIADARGNVAWTIAGRIPRRSGFDASLPASWARAGVGWDGWLAPHEYPSILNPPSGRVWTANARVTEGVEQVLIGDSGYALGARARQIRDSLERLSAAKPVDMLAIQLDDRALFLERWRELLLGVFERRMGDSDRRIAEMRAFVGQWGGRAAIGSVGYRFVRHFRRALHAAVFSALTAECRAADPEFRFVRMRQSEGALWRLVSDRPLHLLNPRYRNWDEQIDAVLDASLQQFFGETDSPVAARTWGEHNTVEIEHPVSRAVPLLATWLNMPREALPGDTHMPRVQLKSAGASERFAVAPGDEASGYFHMPGGQSGHPLSAFYRAGHRAWVRGEPTPFLPGETQHRLRLVPEQ